MTIRNIFFLFFFSFNKSKKTKSQKQTHFLPATEPSFLPLGSSNSTPAQMPSAKSVFPVKRSVPCLTPEALLMITRSPTFKSEDAVAVDIGKMWYQRLQSLFIIGTQVWPVLILKTISINSYHFLVSKILIKKQKHSWLTKLNQAYLPSVFHNSLGLYHSWTGLSRSPWQELHMHYKSFPHFLSLSCNRHKLIYLFLSC